MLPGEKGLQLMLSLQHDSCGSFGLRLFGWAANPLKQRLVAKRGSSGEEFRTQIPGPVSTPAAHDTLSEPPHISLPIPVSPV